MKQPSLDKLMEYVDSKYTLVVAVAKRARGLMETPDALKGVKPVSMALAEISRGKWRIERTREGIK